MAETIIDDIERIKEIGTKVSDKLSPVFSAAQIGISVAEFLGIKDSEFSQLYSKLDKIDIKIEEIQTELKKINEKLIESERKRKIGESLKEIAEFNIKMLNFTDNIKIIFRKTEGEVKKLLGDKVDIEDFWINIDEDQNKQNIYQKALTAEFLKREIKDSQILINLEKEFNNLCNTITAGETAYEATILYYFDRLINSYYNWDEEAYTYREAYRIKIYKLLSLGVSIVGMLNKICNPNERLDDINTKYMSTIKYITVTHGSNRKNTKVSTGNKKLRISGIKLLDKVINGLINIFNTSKINKGPYSLVANKYISYLNKYKGDEIYNKLENKEEIVSFFNVEELEEISYRANNLNRSILEDMIKNEIIDKENTISLLLAGKINNIERSSSTHGYPGGSVTTDIDTVKGYVIDITKKNSKVEKRILFKIRITFSKSTTKNIESNEKILCFSDK